MKSLRFYYSAPLERFLTQNQESILGEIYSNSTAAEVTIQQQSAWKEEIAILQAELSKLPSKEGRILFEYVIPRRGKRVDVVLLYKNIIFLLEFKCGADSYSSSTYDQVYDYALDLHCFQKESQDKLIVPMMVPTQAESTEFELHRMENVAEPIGCNAQTVAQTITKVCDRFSHEGAFDYEQWEVGEYCPTPTIVEAAQALYTGHNVEEITRSDAGAENLTKTTEAIDALITKSRATHEKAICFVTGVPGAGKTLVGLNLAVRHSCPEQREPATFLSGNYPLVTVLQEALARDKREQLKAAGKKVKKAEVLRQTSTFIQIIHKYRDAYIKDLQPPPERIVIFDEAQRAWTHDKIADFMKRKKDIQAFPYSEPAFLIQTMDRHKDWAAIICLVGGGQEINDGEAGLPEWFEALRHSFPEWHVYVSPQLNDEVYTRRYTWKELLSGLRVTEMPELHLATSVRSFRTPKLALFIDALLNLDTPLAARCYAAIAHSYPIVVTRNLQLAKQWLRKQCRGTMRCGILASSGALRLKAEGLFVKNNIDVGDWFLNPKTDVRSSYQLEDVATEFDVQGLELDFSLVAWDADFRYHEGTWQARQFRGATWIKHDGAEQFRYRKNAYRVLLTRARQGMIIFIPQGDAADDTRLPQYYDGTYEYLRSLGIPDLSATEG